MKATLKTPFTELMTFRGTTLLLLVVAMTLNTLLESFGMALFMPLLFSLGLIGAGEAGPLIETLTSGLAFLGISPTPLGIGSAALGTLLLQAVLGFIQGAQIARISSSYAHRRRLIAFERVISSRWRLLSQTDVSVFINAVAGEVQKMATALGYTLQMVAQILTAIVYLAVALLASWKVTLLLIALGSLLWLGSRKMVRSSREVGERLTAASERFFSWVGQVFYSLKLIKSTGAEKYGFDEFAEGSRILSDEERRYTRAPFSLRLVLEVGAAVSLIACLMISRSVFHLDAIATLFVLGVFYRLYPRVTTIQQFLQSIHLNLPAFEYVQRVEAQAVAENEMTLLELQTPEDAKLVQFETVSLEEVSVRYGEFSALERAEIKLRRNQFIGIVGRSGSGKTTLLDCVLGLNLPSSGRVCVDQTDLKNLDPRNWRRGIGYVGQDTVLFNFSIRENIQWNLKGITREEITSAAKKADADEFIRSFPESYETKVGDRGGRISGGQRQRIGIARALARKPSLLILDEATSALDPHSEAEILKTLQHLKGQVTILFVTHRIASLRHADQIYVLEGGRVVQSGSWDKLSQAQGPFQSLLREQIGPAGSAVVAPLAPGQDSRIHVAPDQEQTVLS